MKKLVTLALTLILTLSIFATASATPFYLESAGVTIEVPDGMTGTDQSGDETSVLGITVDGNTALVYAYVVRYMDELEGMGLQDLSQEEGDQLVAGISAAMDNPQLAAAEVNGYPVLVVANGDGTQLHYISLLNGWLCDVAAAKNDGVALEDSEVAVAAQLLTSITFDEYNDAEQAEEGEEVAEEEAEVEEDE